MNKLVPPIGILLIITFTTQSCTLLFFNERDRIRVEYDSVKNTKRITKDFFYYKTEEKQSPLYSIKQTILKELKPKGEITYTVYDNLTMNPSAQSLENQLYLIFFDEIIPINIKEIEIEQSSNISEEKGTILTADSTRVSIVKGYTQSNKKHYKISYQLSTEVIQRINYSSKVNFRYYCGPNMITTTLDENKLNRLKEMIAAK